MPRKKKPGALRGRPPGDRRWGRDYLLLPIAEAKFKAGNPKIFGLQKDLEALGYGLIVGQLKLKSLELSAHEALTQAVDTIPDNEVRRFGASRKAIVQRLYKRFMPIDWGRAPPSAFYPFPATSGLENRGDAYAPELAKAIQHDLGNRKRTRHRLRED
jgi:hypothetical protein